MSQSETISVSSIINDSPIGSHRFAIFLLALILAMLDGFDNVMLSLAAPAISAELGITRPMLASVFTATLFGLAFGAFLLGFAGDKLGRRPCTLICVALFGFFTLTLPLGKSVTALMVFRFFAGAGIGGLLPNVCSLVSEFSPRTHRQTAVLVISGGIAAGAMLGGVVGATVLPTFGWHELFYIAGACTIVAFAGACFLLPESIRFLATRDETDRAIGNSLKRIAPNLVVQPGARFELEEVQTANGNVSQLFSNGLALTTTLLWLNYILVLAVMYLFFQWLPTLVQDFNFSSQMAVFTLTAFNLGGIIGSFLLGPMASRWGMYLVAPINFLLIIPSVLLMAYAHGDSATLIVGAFSAGWTVMGGLGVINSLAADNYPTQIRSTGIGWASGIGRLGSATSPSLIGLLLATGWQAGEIVLLPIVPAVVMALATTAIGRLRRRRSKDVFAAMPSHA